MIKSSFKVLKLFIVSIVLFAGLSITFSAEAQLLKKLKKKVENKAEQLKQKSLDKLNRKLDQSIDSAFVRAEGIFGKKGTKREEGELVDKGEAGGYGAFSFGDEEYNLDKFLDVICIYHPNGVSVEAIANERFGVLFYLIGDDFDKKKHRDKYEVGNTSENKVYVSYFTRPHLPWGVGSALKEGQLRVVSLDESSLFLSASGKGGDEENDELIDMMVDLKLDFSITLESDRPLKMPKMGKSSVSTIDTSSVPQVNTSDDSMSDDESRAMEFMQQMMGGGDAKVPDQYRFDYMVSYEFDGVTESKTKYTTWVGHNGNTTMLSFNDDNGNNSKLIIDGDNQLTLSVDEANKQVMVVSSDIMGDAYKDLAFQMEEESLKGGGFKKTGRSRRIAGYLSYEYEIEGQGGQGNIWFSSELDITSFWPGMNNANKSELPGFMMEFNFKGDDGEERHIRLKKVSKEIMLFNLGDYQVMNMAGFGK